MEGAAEDEEFGKLRMMIECIPDLQGNVWRSDGMLKM